jgi:tRNA-specific 2-thiouridylase
MDLCFLGDGDHRRFLNEYAPQAATPGPILASDGAVLGEHQGLFYYTIGQRKGLGISTGQPLYVLHKDIARNALIVGPRAQLGIDSLLVRDVTWLTPTTPAAALPVTAKIRYQAAPVAAQVTALADGGARVQFANPVFGATAGQGVTFYDGPVVLGGGIIADAVSMTRAAADYPPGAKG